MHSLTVKKSLKEHWHTLWWQFSLCACTCVYLSPSECDRKGELSIFSQCLPETSESVFNHRAIRNTIWIHTPLPSYQSLSTIAYWERCQNSVCPHSPHQFPKEYIIYLLKNPQRAQQTEPGRYCLCHVYMETYFVGSSVSKPSASSRLLSNINILCWSKFISCFIRIVLPFRSLSYPVGCQLLNATNNINNL